MDLLFHDVIQTQGSYNALLAGIAAGVVEFIVTDAGHDAGSLHLTYGLKGPAGDGGIIVKTGRIVSLWHKRVRAGAKNSGPQKRPAERVGKTAKPLFDFVISLSG